METQREFRYVAEGYENDIEIFSKHLIKLIEKNKEVVGEVRSENLCGKTRIKSYVDILDKDIGKFSSLLFEYRDHCKLWSNTAPEVGSDWVGFHEFNT